MDWRLSKYCMHEKVRDLGWAPINNEGSTWELYICLVEPFAMHRQGNGRCDWWWVLHLHLCLRTAQGMTNSHLEWAELCADALHFWAQMARVQGEWPLVIGFLHEEIAFSLDPVGPWLLSWSFHFGSVNLPHINSCVGGCVHNGEWTHCWWSIHCWLDIFLIWTPWLVVNFSKMIFAWTVMSDDRVSRKWTYGRQEQWSTKMMVALYCLHTNLPFNCAMKPTLVLII